MGPPRQGRRMELEDRPIRRQLPPQERRIHGPLRPYRGGRRSRRISFPRVSRRPAAPSCRSTRGYSPSLLRSGIEDAKLADSVTDPVPPTLNTSSNLYLRLVYEYDDTARTRRRP